MSAIPGETTRADRKGRLFLWARPGNLPSRLARYWLSCPLARKTG
jgi:hypothetical protein